MENKDIIKNIRTAEDAPQDPIPLFEQWMEEAQGTDPGDVNAMCLATLGSDGRISSRIMLLKGVTDGTFIFYTNRESRKGQALASNPFAAINFHWKALGRQVRIEGTIEKVSDAESDAYFATRPRGSQIGAWASLQSQTLKDRAILEQRISDLEEQYKNDSQIPRPPHWGGYRLTPERIEFWHAGDYRLHSRIAYIRTAGGAWDKEMMFP